MTSEKGIPTDIFQENWSLNLSLKPRNSLTPPYTRNGKWNWADNLQVRIPTWNLTLWVVIWLMWFGLGGYVICLKILNRILGIYIGVDCPKVCRSLEPSLIMVSAEPRNSPCYRILSYKIWKKDHEYSKKRFSGRYLVHGLIGPYRKLIRELMKIQALGLCRRTPFFFHIKLCVT